MEPFVSCRTSERNVEIVHGEVIDSGSCHLWPSQPGQVDTRSCARTHNFHDRIVPVRTGWAPDCRTMCGMKRNRRLWVLTHILLAQGQRDYLE